LVVSDFPEPKGGEAIQGLARTIRIKAGENTPKNLYFLVSKDSKINDLGGGVFGLGSRLSVQASGAAVGKAVVRGNELLLPVHLKPGVNEFLLNYTLK
jgi:hypothetical protein